MNYATLRAEDVPRADLKPGPWNFAMPRGTMEELASTGRLTALLGAFISFGTIIPGFQSAGSWFAHAETWKQRGDTPPVLRLRYEDLVQRGAAAFAEIGAWFGFDGAQSAAAYRAASEDTAKDSKFFWRQRAFGYSDILTKEQIALFEGIYGARVAQLGYEI